MKANPLTEPSRPVAVAVPKLGEHRGRTRLWLEGMKLTRAGISPGDRYRIFWDKEANRVILDFTDDGDRVVSRRERHNRVMPIIDVGSESLESALGEGLERAQVSIYRGRIEVSVHPDDLLAKERIERLVGKLRSGEALATGSVAHGGGIIDHAIHGGLADRGVRAELAFVIEIDADAIDVAASRNPIWSADTLEVHAPLEAVDPAILPKVEILVMGLPCTGASKAGKAKRGLKHAEEHPTAGMLVVPALQVAKATGASLIVLENVPDYAHSASAELLRRTLTVWGYDVHETIIDGNAFGGLEDRRRLCMIAVSRKLSLDLEALVPTREKEATLAAILEDIGPDSDKWRSFAHHVAKAARDKEKGSNFKLNLIDPASEKVGTMGSGYHKDRQTEPHLRHPTDPDKARLLTPVEHARAKTIPPELVEGLAPMLAHRILGNSVVWEAWRAVGRHMGDVMLAAADVTTLDGEATFSALAEPAGFHVTAEAEEFETDLFGRLAPSP